MTTPLISSLYLALLVMLIVALAVRVAVARLRTRTGLGEGTDKHLHSAIRAHGNAVEHIPLALMLMFAAEYSGLGTLWLHIAGITLIASRILHTWGLHQSHGKSLGRQYGMLLCWLTMIGLSVYLIFCTLPAL